MGEIILLVILHTSRAASHGHELVYERLETLTECNNVGNAYKAKDSRNSFACIPVKE